MARTKGSLLRRVLHPDFLGINWTTISFRTPFNNLYPITLSGGPANRGWSNPASFGHFAHRMGRIHLRHSLLMFPTMYAALIFMMQPDWYTFLTGHTFVIKEILGITINLPESWIEYRRKEMAELTSTKPGVLLKHKAGGQVSIPGSENLIT